MTASTSEPQAVPARIRPWTQIIRIVKPLFLSEVKWRAIAWLASLLLLLLTISQLNILNSFVNNDFMTAITKRNPVIYRQMAIRYVLVFVALTVVSVFVRFAEERLGLLWRNWLTSHLLDKYLSNRSYLRLLNRADIDNPDQRLTEDVKNFTTTTLSFFLLFLNAGINALAFSWLLYKISPLLLGVAIGYSLFGSVVTMLVGRKLINLNNLQLKKEANFRYELIHVREYGESIALLKGERQQLSRLQKRLKEVVDNFRTIIAINRNLGFFTNIYKYLFQVIPIVIVAPAFIRGEIEFGTVTQSAGAFVVLIDAFSLIITQFQQISTFAAVVNRLGTIWEALDHAPTAVGDAIEIVTDESRIAFDGLNIRATKDNQSLIRDLNIEITMGRRLLITGAEGMSRTALARAIAGIWPTGEGRIYRPSSDNIMFVPQRPYAALGSLRDQFFDTEMRNDEDERLIAILCQVTFGPILERVGGLDVERDWSSLLTVGEQQLLGIARLMVSHPKFAVLDRATSALSLSRVKHIYNVLSTTETTYITIGDHPALKNYHDNVLELQGNGQWTFGPASQWQAPVVIEEASKGDLEEA